VIMLENRRILSDSVSELIKASEVRQKRTKCYKDTKETIYMQIDAQMTLSSVNCVSN